MALESPPWALQSQGYGAEQTRRATFFGFVRQGVQELGKMSIVPGGGLSVNVTGGQCLVAGTHSDNQGLYYCFNDGNFNIALASNTSGDPRIDRIVATIDDAAYAGGSANDWKLQAVTGTPTGGANLVNLSGGSSVPADSLHLGWVLVPSGGASITSDDILSNPKVASGPVTPGEMFVPRANGYISTDPYHTGTAGVFQTLNDGVYHLYAITIIGGGGGGGAGGNSASGPGGGGGGGGAGLFKRVLISLPPNSKYDVDPSIGGAGQAGAPAGSNRKGNDGGNGGASTFTGPGLPGGQLAMGGGYGGVGGAADGTGGSGGQGSNPSYPNTSYPHLYVGSGGAGGTAAGPVTGLSGNAMPGAGAGGGGGAAGDSVSHNGGDYGNTGHWGSSGGAGGSGHVSGGDGGDANDIDDGSGSGGGGGGGAGSPTDRGGNSADGSDGIILIEPLA